MATSSIYPQTGDFKKTGGEAKKKKKKKKKEEEEEKSPERPNNEIDFSSLIDSGFKKEVIKMLKELRKNISRKIYHCQKELQRGTNQK